MIRVLVVDVAVADFVVVGTLVAGAAAVFAALVLSLLLLLLLWLLLLLLLLLLRLLLLLLLLLHLLTLLFACKVQGILFTSTAYAPHVFSHVVPLPIVHPHDFYETFTRPFYMGGQPGGDTWGA